MELMFEIYVEKVIQRKIQTYIDDNTRSTFDQVFYQIFRFQKF